MSSAANVARISATCVSAAWAGVLLVTDIKLQADLRRGLAYLPSAVGLGVVAFDLWLWKIPGVSKLTGRPHLYGTWQAAINPSPSSRIPEGGNQGPISAAVVIEQTFWTVAVSLHTQESSSSSATAAIAALPESKHQDLIFTYSNQPLQKNTHRSNLHAGTSKLAVQGTHPTDMVGRYWTDRLTAGDLDLELVDRKTDRTRKQALARSSDQRLEQP